MAGKNLKESDIIPLILRGESHEAIQFLYKNVFPIVKKFVLQRKGSSDDAFDIFQDSLMETYQKIWTNQYPSQFTICGYLYKVCTFKWLNRQKRNQKIEYTETLPDIAFEETKFRFINTDEENIIQQLFSKIGNKCVELLTMTFIYELSLEEITEKLGFVSIAATKMQHMRCKEKMTKLAKEYPFIIDQLKEKLNDR